MCVPHGILSELKLGCSTAQALCNRCTIKKTILRVRSSARSGDDTRLPPPTGIKNRTNVAAELTEQVDRLGTGSPWIVKHTTFDTIWPEFDQANLASFRPCCDGFGQTWAVSTKVGPGSARVGPGSVKLGDCTQVSPESSNFPVGL